MYAVLGIVTDVATIKKAPGFEAANSSSPENNSLARDEYDTLSLVPFFESVAIRSSFMVRCNFEFRQCQPVGPTT